ncbi:hypothetical protein Noda2021_05030 [Candidatus Dependentiae bacterium Noda2021]|nr:hypothetical protein Noda2021_05030 [Candidatus Dependentiae bacterium Noda2021]
MKTIILLATVAHLCIASEQYPKKAVKSVEKTRKSSNRQLLTEYESHKRVLGDKEISKELRDWIEDIALSMGDKRAKVKTLPIHTISPQSVLNPHALSQGIISINYGLQTKTGIWLNTDMVKGDEIKYVATHELAHWILRHHYKKQYPYQQEFQADELALNTLVKQNKMDIVLNELINRNFIEHNYSLKEIVNDSESQRLKISYPTEKERAQYYKKIIEKLPNKKADLPTSLLKKNRKLMIKQLYKPTIVGKIGCAAVCFYHGYQCAKEASKVNTKIRKQQLNSLQTDSSLNNLIDHYAQSKKIALLSAGLVAASGTTFLYPIIKTHRAALLFKKKGLL